MISHTRTAIQGEPGSNSHLAARAMLGPSLALVPCRLSADVVTALLAQTVEAAVLPIENSLHGSVAEHYDLFLHHPLRIEAEFELRIEHHLIAAPGVQLTELRRVLSHPVALSQCRRFLGELAQAQAEPFFDTAGSVHHVVSGGLRDAAGIAPRLAAELYGGEILAANIEDHPENLTRFHLLRRADLPRLEPGTPNKLSVAFALEHRPGSLVRALQALAQAGVDLTKVESRPTPGRPWEYTFFVDFRFAGGDGQAEAALTALRTTAHMVKELGRYLAA